MKTLNLVGWILTAYALKLSQGTRFYYSGSFYRRRNYYYFYYYILSISAGFVKNRNLKKSLDTYINTALTESNDKAEALKKNRQLLCYNLVLVEKKSVNQLFQRVKFSTRQNCRYMPKWFGSSGMMENILRPLWSKRTYNENPNILFTFDLFN